MAGLALKGVMYGADKIPDSWFHKVPGGYYRPKDDKKGKKDKRRSRRHSDADRRYEEEEDDDYYVSDENDDRRGRRVQTPREEDDASDDRNHRGRGKSMDAMRDFDGPRYEEPSPGAPYMYANPYNPTAYAPAGAVPWEGYYPKPPQDLATMDGTRYVAPVVAGAAAAHYMDSQRPSSTASSSGPTSGYVPYADVYGTERQDSHKTKLQRDAERYPHNPDYQPPYQSENPYYRAPYVSDYRSTSDSPHSRTSDEPRRHRQERDSSRSRHKSKSRHRSRARSLIHDRFDPSDKGLQYGTIGAVAGGLLGNEAGKGGLFPTVAGAVIGGLGANAYETREKHKKEARKMGKHDDRYKERYDSRYDDGRHGSRRHSRRYDGYYSD